MSRPSQRSRLDRPNNILRPSQIIQLLTVVSFTENSETNADSENKLQNTDIHLTQVGFLLTGTSANFS